MTQDISSWRLRLFVIILIGGGMVYFAESSFFGILSGSAMLSDGLMLGGLTAVLAFLFEALPSAFLGRPKSIANPKLQSHWASGYVLAWLAMTAVWLIISSGLQLLLTAKSASIDSVVPMFRWIFLLINMLASVASSYALIFMLNLRFSQNEWGSDWQWPVLILAGGQIAYSVLFSFASIIFDVMPPLMLTASGVAWQVVHAVLMAWALGEWRRGIETQSPTGNGMVF